MGRYRARDLVNAPTLVSLARVPLAAAFPLALDTPWLSLAVLALAGLSDVVDGALARRLGLATPTGAVVDGATDKLFVGVVLVTLVMAGRLSARDVGLLGTRELGEAPLVAWLLVSPAARQRKVDDRANALGKLATVLQFATVAAVLLRVEVRAAVMWITSIVGMAAAASYWLRAVRRARS